MLTSIQKHTEDSTSVLPLITVIFSKITNHKNLFYFLRVAKAVCTPNDSAKFDEFCFDYVILEKYVKNRNTQNMKKTRFFRKPSATSNRWFRIWDNKKTSFLFQKLKMWFSILFFKISSTVIMMFWRTHFLCNLFLLDSLHFHFLQVLQKTFCEYDFVIVICYWRRTVRNREHYFEKKRIWSAPVEGK